MRTWTCAVALALLPGLIAPAAAQPPASPTDRDKPPAPGTTGDPDNVPFIGKRDPQGNPVRLAKATGHVSNYSEDKVAPYTLPDPLVTSDKRPVTTAEMWVKQRRPEILKFFRDEVYGAVPANAPKVTWEVTETDDNARQGTAVMRRVGQELGNTPAVARSSYVSPAVIDQYLDGRTIEDFRPRHLRIVSAREISLELEEQAVLSLLRSWRIRQARAAA